MHSAQPFQNGFKESVIAIILRDVIQGLEYLHTIGYVHRYVYYMHMWQSWLKNISFSSQCPLPWVGDLHVSYFM